MIRNLCCLFVLFAFQAGIAQTVTGRVVDSNTGEGLSYADIQINGSENLIGNADGYFTIPEKSSVDGSSLTVSFLGYNSVRMTLGELRNNGLTVKLQPGVFELEAVNISNANFQPDSIMAAVKKNMARNYKETGQPEKDMLFYRESVSFRPIKLKVELDKSTGFDKEGLKKANAQLKALTSRLVAHPPQEYTDMLCNYYTGTAKIKDKPVFSSKLEVLKAIKLKDKNRSGSVDDVEQMAAEVLYQHLDSTKYYRIKSGLFGSRDTISLRKNKKKEKAKSHLNGAKAEVTGFMYENNFLQSRQLDFATNLELYSYEYGGAIQSDDNEFVYVIKFKPEKRKAKYTGTLYISEKDYAVVRADYALGEGKILDGVNLKFLLGVKQAENVSKGTVIFKKRHEGEGYYLQYASEEEGQYIYINRPLKFIEMTSGEKDVVAFDLKVETNILDKKEYFNMSRSEITQTDFEKAKEPDFNYIRLTSYDPKIWKEYSAIEPLEEMKQFKAVEE